MPSKRSAYVLTLPSDLRLLPLARTFIESICQAMSFDRCFTDAVQLATHEGLRNIIRHAHENCADALFEVQAGPIDGGIEVRLLDEGKPFDIVTVPHLEPGELRIGGRGVFLMRRLVDEIHSEPRRPCGNILRLVKHVRPAIRRHLA